MGGAAGLAHGRGDVQESTAVRVGPAGGGAQRSLRGEGWEPPAACGRRVGFITWERRAGGPGQGRVAAPQGQSRPPAWFRAAGRAGAG